MTEFEVREIIRKERLENNPGCLGMLMVLLSIICAICILLSSVWRLERIDRALGFSKDFFSEWFREEMLNPPK